MDAEVWKPIPDADGYEVSDRGRVRTYYWRNRWWPEPRLLALTPREDGYLRTTIHGETRYVHQLVLSAFGREPQPGEIVRHREGNPADNAPSQLEWGSRSLNNRDTARHGRVNTQKLSEDEAWGVKLLVKHEVPGPDIQRLYPHASIGMISCIRRGTTWGHLIVD